MNLREAAQLALDALEDCAMTIDWGWGDCRELEEMRETGEYTPGTTAAITALRAALAENALHKLNDIHQEMEQEPVAWITEESISRLAKGGNAKRGTVPVHKARSNIARHPLYAEPRKISPFPMNPELKETIKDYLDRCYRITIAKPEQEPIAYYDPQEKGFYWAKPTQIKTPMTVTIEPLPLYAAPTPRKPLTEEEIGNICLSFRLGYTDQDFARAIERAHGIGGSDE